MIELLVYSFFGIWIGGLLYSIVIHNYRDIIQTKISKRRPKKGKKPLITVVVYAYNNETTIEHALQSVIQNDYKKLHVLIVDNASDDTTGSLVKSWLKNKSKNKYRVVTKRKAGAKREVLLSAIKKHAKGDLVILLNGNLALGKDSIKNAVDYMNRGGIDHLVFQPISQGVRKTLGSVDQAFNALHAFRFRQFGVTNEYERSAWQAAAIYKREALMMLLKSQQKPLVKLLNTFDACTVRHLDDSITLRQSKENIELLESFDLKQRVLRTTLGVFELGMLVYFVYLAVVFQVPQFLIMSWLIMSGVIVFASLTDPELTTRDKFNFVLLSPLVIVTRFLQITKLTFRLSETNWLKRDWKSATNRFRLSAE